MNFFVSWIWKFENENNQLSKNILASDTPSKNKINKVKLFYHGKIIINWMKAVFEEFIGCSKLGSLSVCDISVTIRNLNIAHRSIKSVFFFVKFITII